MLSMRSCCKNIKEIISKVTNLRLKQTSSFINDLEEFQSKYKMLKTIMPNLSFMSVSLEVNLRKIMCSKPSLKHPPRLRKKGIEYYQRDLREHFSYLFSWLSTERLREQSSLKDVDTKIASEARVINSVIIDCELTLTSSKETIPSSTLINMLIFELRSSFTVNKLRRYVNDDKNNLHTCFKIKGSILTFSKYFPTVRVKMVYEEDKEYAANLDALPWETITGVKIKCHPDSQLKGRVIDTTSGKRYIVSVDPRDGSRKFQRPVELDVTYNKLHPKIKALPLTTNKTCVLRYA